MMPGMMPPTSLFSPSMINMLKGKLAEAKDQLQQVLGNLEKAMGAGGLSSAYRADMNKTMGSVQGGCCHTAKPQQGMENAITLDLRKQGVFAHQALKGGGYTTGLQGMLIESGIGGSKYGRLNYLRAKGFEKRIHSDPAFKKQVETMLGGKIVGTGANKMNGVITVIPNKYALPTNQAGSMQSFNRIGAGGAFAGLAKLQQGIMNFMKKMGGPQAMLTGLPGLALGGVGAMYMGNKMAELFGPETRNKISLTASNLRPGNSGARERALPANASFEQILEAFMFDFAEKKQKEIKDKMNKMKAAEKKKNSPLGKIGGFLKGMLPAVAGAAGMMFGGPIGGMIGSSVGGAASGAMTGGKSQRSEMIEMEELKQMVNEMNRMMQMVSNVLKSMHDASMNAVRKIG